jgi:hypothetical protein
MRTLIIVVGILVSSSGVAQEDLSVGPPRVKKLKDGRFEVLFRYRPDDDVRTVALAG